MTNQDRATRQKNAPSIPAKIPRTSNTSTKPNPQEVQDKLEEFEKLNSQSNSNADSRDLRIQKRTIEEQQEDTRSELARVFVWGFFTIITFCLIAVPLYNVWVFNAFGLDSGLKLDLIEVVTLMGSIIGTSLGFVTGFYFKTIADRKK